jgi:DNA mismatch repair protein MutL
MKIKKLSTETINLISAGEVIEGPSDILKELIENSIDANATEIIVEIKSSGIDYLSVKDNGDGIEKDDLAICLEKYTTSKLKEINDLYDINSFGFRGEALSTISAVSKYKIISSVTDDGSAHILENNNLSQTTSKKGTTIILEDLFYNIPVRKKFLKSKSFEYSKLYDVFLANALIFPEITFKFISEKKNVVFSKTDFKNRLVQIYGIEIVNKTIPIDINNEFFKLKGVLTNPENPIYLPTNFLFINKRYVYSPQIYKAITDSYKDYLMIQQKPFFILFITINPKTVDVNVHPKKRVVKLQNELLFLSELKKELSLILNDKLGKQIPKTNFDSLKDFLSNKEKITNIDTNNFSLKKEIFKDNYDYTPQKNLFFTDSSFEKQNISNFNLFEFEIFKVFGQLKKTFILCETNNGLLLIDQHAADERINLEKNRVKYDFIEKQKLISDLKLDNLKDSYIDLLKNNKQLIDKLGFEFYFKEDVVYLKTIPIFLNKLFDKNIFFNFLKDIEEGTNEIYKLKDNLLKLKSCKESIKANDVLSLEEQITLIKKLNSCSDKGICAHGRPTIINISIKDLEKLFKRIV